MDNPKYEHENGAPQNSTININNGNLHLNYGTRNNDVICKYHIKY